MAQSSWRGVFPALTTLFTERDTLDFKALEEHLQWQLAAGVHGIIILGSLGENSTLDAAEKRDMMTFYADRIGGSVPLLACVAESATRDAVSQVQAGAEAGVDGFMLLPPMRYPSDRRETLAYLREVGSASELPVMLYNNPVAYGTDLVPEDFLELGDVSQFQAIKESSADTRRIADLRRVTGDRYALFCGVDDLALECFALGAVGWVAGLVVALPRETLELYRAMTAGDWDRARAIYDWFLPLLHLDIGPKFVQQIKLVQEILGRGSARVRPPRLPLSAAERKRIAAVVEHAMAHRHEALDAS